MSLPAVSRPGFAVDEEFTWFAVSGIRSHGLPLLPSGVFYERGLLYSYLAWGGGRLLGDSLAAYRTVSLCLALAVVILGWWVAKILWGHAGAGIVTAVLATWPTLVAHASWARFYAGFLTTLLLVLLIFFLIERGRLRTWTFAAAIVTCRLMHEFGALMIALPFCYLLTDHQAPLIKTRLMMVVASVVALASMQLVFAAGHTLGSTGIATSMFLPVPLQVATFSGLTPLFVGWSIVLAIEFFLVKSSGRSDATRLVYGALGVPLQLGAIVMVGAAASLAQPERARTHVARTIGAVLASVLMWSVWVSLRTQTPFGWNLISSLATFGLSYPTAGVSFLARTFPFLATLAASLLVPLIALSPDSTRTLRGLTLLSLIWVFALGVLATGFEDRYLAGCLLLLFVTVGGALASMWRIIPSARLRRVLCPLTAVAVLGLIWNEQILWTASSHQWAARVRNDSQSIWRLPTAAFPELPMLADRIGDADQIVCDNELLCVFYFGRIDRWLVTVPQVVKEYSMPGADERVGIYGGTRILPSMGAMVRWIEREHKHGWVVLLDPGPFSPPSGIAVLAGVREAAIPVSIQVDRPGLFIALMAPSASSRGSEPP